MLPAPLKRWRRMFWPLLMPKTQLTKESPPKTISRKFSVGRQLLPFHENYSVSKELKNVKVPSLLSAIVLIGMKNEL